MKEKSTKTSSPPITVEYGEVIPNYNIKKIDQGSGISYELYRTGETSIFNFQEKPISKDKYLKDEKKKMDPPSYAGWLYDIANSMREFKFSSKVRNSIIESGWDVDKLKKEKRFDELDQKVYLYNLIGKLIES